MKIFVTISSIILLILSILITYLGLQRDSLVNPPTITGVGFLVIAIALFLSKKFL